MAWERIALGEIVARVAEIESVPASAATWVAAVVWLYAPYPRELQEAWTAAAAAAAKRNASCCTAVMIGKRSKHAGNS